MFGSIQKALVVGLVGFALAAVAVPGLAFLRTPFRRPPPSPWLLVGPLASVPDDGLPRLFPLRKFRRDSWSVSLEETGQRIFLRRLPGSRRVEAFPPYHVSNGMRIPLVYEGGCQVFRSACRKVDFTLDGRLLEPDKHRWVSEDLQPLPVRLVGGEVYVALEG